MTHINGITMTSKTSAEALQAVFALETVIFAVSEMDAKAVKISELVDLQTLIEEKSWKISLLSTDAFEAEVAMELSVWFSRIGILINKLDRAQ